MNVLYIPISNKRLVKKKKEKERVREETKRKDEKTRFRCLRITKMRRLKAKFPRISYLDAGKGYWTDSDSSQSLV